MSEMIVSWKYEIKTVTGEQFLEYFQCLEAIKLEISYRFFLVALKNKEKKERLEPMLKFVSLIDGIVDLSKFEIDKKAS